MAEIATTTEKKDERLRAASHGEILDALQDLWAAFDTKATEDPKRTTVAYVLALEGQPLWAIREAVKRFVQGVVTAASTKFAPRPPELATVVRNIVQPVRDEVARNESIARARLRDYGQPAAEMTQEQRTRMKFKLALLSAAQGSEPNLAALHAATQMTGGAGLIEMIRLAGMWGVPVPENIVAPVEEYLP